MAYVYRHIRHDKNVPFYIGIGVHEQPKKKGKYQRAYATSNRSKRWQNIINKTSYHVDILIDNITIEEANRKEIEFISLYKTKENGGTLVNLTLGGGGQLGVKRVGWNKGIKPKKESVEKMRATLKDYYKNNQHHFQGKKHSPESLRKMSQSNMGKTAWNKGIPLSSRQSEILKQAREKQKRSVIKYDERMNALAEYKSLHEASKVNNVRASTLSRYCNDDRIKARSGVVWRFK